MWDARRRRRSNEKLFHTLWWWRRKRAHRFICRDGHHNTTRRQLLRGVHTKKTLQYFCVENIQIEEREKEQHSGIFTWKLFSTKKKHFQSHSHSLSSRKKPKRLKRASECFFCGRFHGAQRTQRKYSRTQFVARKTPRKGHFKFVKD